MLKTNHPAEYWTGKVIVPDNTWLLCQAKLYQLNGSKNYFDKFFQLLPKYCSLNREFEEKRCQELGPFRYFPELLAKCKKMTNRA